jgi:tetratricopeptide (TPR) repeat protein
MIAGTAALIDQNGTAINRPFNKLIPQDLRDLLLCNPLHVGSVLLRRSWQEKIGFFDESLRSYEDWDFWLRLALAGAKMVSINKVVSFYRFHTAQMTRNQNQMTEASFAVLDKVFHQDNLPQSWLDYKNHAYSQSHLRAAANAYAAKEFQDGKDHLEKAVALNPVLLQNNAQEIFQQILAWTELPKVKNRLNFLENILNHLPVEIKDSASNNSRKILSKYAVDQGFLAYKNNDFENVRKYIISAVRYNPRWLLNRGVLSIFFRSLFKRDIHS